MAVVSSPQRLFSLSAQFFLAAFLMVGLGACVVIGDDDVVESYKLVTLSGRPEMVTSEWIKEGAVVVDVGINRVDDSTRERGWRLAGDVHPDVAEKASWLSPVPGGVGPMTIAMLLANTVKAANRRSESVN